MIDVTDVPGQQQGDEVVIMDFQGCEISVEEIVGKTGTINYEVLCDFGNEMHKRYIDAADGNGNATN